MGVGFPRWRIEGAGAAASDAGAQRVRGREIEKERDREANGSYPESGAPELPASGDVDDGDD
jgi:hypothetical protein